MRRKPRFSVLLTLIALFGAFVLPVHAQNVDDLEADIEKKQERVQEIDGLINSYKDKIESRRAESESLENQIVILDNRVAEKELAVEKTQLEIDSLNLEIQLAEKEIEIKGEKISKQKELIGELIREIHQSDAVSTLDILLGQGSLSAFFAEAEELKDLQKDLGQTIGKMKVVKQDLEDRKTEKETKQVRVEEEQRSLKKEMLSLEAEKNFKESLIAQTQESELEFQRILYELRQQQQSASSEIAELEERLKDQLNSVDEALARGDNFLTWPVDPSRGITVIFHDPGYPFRHLFEHSGTDIRASVGTQVKSAGGGYVAWNKTGRMYGNYMMVIHAGGLATVYAHLSKFIASADTFVERGDTIALSGGAPGMQGAGLSTGPHLHFEVRKDGIPVDPENYLPQVPGSYYDYYEDYKRWGLRL